MWFFIVLINFIKFFTKTEPVSPAIKDEFVKRTISAVLRNTDHRKFSTHVRMNPSLPRYQFCLSRFSKVQLTSYESQNDYWMSRLKMCTKRKARLSRYLFLRCLVIVSWKNSNCSELRNWKKLHDSKLNCLKENELNGIVKKRYCINS